MLNFAWRYWPVPVHTTSSDPDYISTNCSMRFTHTHTYSREIINISSFQGKKWKRNIDLFLHTVKVRSFKCGMTGWQRNSDNIREWTGLEFAKSQRVVEIMEKWRKRVAKSSVVSQHPLLLRDWWDGMITTLLGVYQFIPGLMTMTANCVLKSHVQCSLKTVQFLCAL